MQRDAIESLYHIARVHSNVDKFLKKRHELRREFSRRLEELCRGPLPEDRPGAISHLTAQYLCLYRYRAGKTRLIYEVNRDRQEINLIDLEIRDKAYAG